MRLTSQSQRQSECPLRRSLSCGDVDVALGWMDSMPLSECDKCWAKGGPYTPEAKAWRETHVSLIVSAVKRAGVETFRADVQRAMLDKWVHSSDKPMIVEKIIERGTDKPYVRWLGVTWEGVPMPQRPWKCLKVAYKSFIGMWAALRNGGCGCSVKAKAVVKKLVGK